jgi:hypothetical protein
MMPTFLSRLWKHVFLNIVLRLNIRNVSKLLRNFSVCFDVKYTLFGFCHLLRGQITPGYLFHKLYVLYVRVVQLLGTERPVSICKYTREQRC